MSVLGHLRLSAISSDRRLGLPGVAQVQGNYNKTDFQAGQRPAHPKPTAFMALLLGCPSLVRSTVGASRIKTRSSGPIF